MTRAKIYKFQFIVETEEHGSRQIEADSFEERDGWLIFRRDPATGGSALECWRVRVEKVVSLETKR